MAAVRLSSPGLRPFLARQESLTAAILRCAAAQAGAASIAFGFQIAIEAAVVAELETNKNAPSHRVYVGRAEIGAAWSKRSSEGRDYLSVKLDDPSFNAPIYANLFNDEDGETFSLIWSRARNRNGD